MHNVQDAASFLSWITVRIWKLLGGKERPKPPPPEDVEIAQLKASADRDALFAILEQEKHTARGLDAAQALAELGDGRGVDRMIDELNGPSEYRRDVARGMLEQLHDPRGDLALHAVSEAAVAPLPTPLPAAPPAARAPAPRLSKSSWFVGGIGGIVALAIFTFWLYKDGSWQPLLGAGTVGVTTLAICFLPASLLAGGLVGRIVDPYGKALAKFTGPGSEDRAVLPLLGLFLLAGIVAFACNFMLAVGGAF